MKTRLREIPWNCDAANYLVEYSIILPPSRPTKFTKFNVSVWFFNYHLAEATKRSAEATYSQLPSLGLRQRRRSGGFIKQGDNPVAQVRELAIPRLQTCAPRLARLLLVELRGRRGGGQKTFDELRVLNREVKIRLQR